MWQALPAALLYIGWGTHRSTVPKCRAVIYPFLNKDLFQRSWQWVGPSYPRLVSPYWHPDKLLPLNVQLVLVLLLLLWQSTVPRVSYERKHLIGFIVSWVIVMVEQSHGGKNSWGLKPWSVSRRAHWTSVSLLKPLGLHPSDTPSPAGPYLLILSKKFHRRGPSIQTPESTGAVLI